MSSEEVLKILIQLSKADNYFHEFEFSYLLKVGRHLEIEDDKVETLIQRTDTTRFTEIPQKEEDRMVIIYYMLFLMKIDHKITEEEKELVHHYGFKLGFSAPMIDEFIDIMEKNKDKNVETDKMLSVLRKYQN